MRSFGNGRLRYQPFQGGPPQLLQSRLALGGQQTQPFVQDGRHLDRELYI